MTLNPYTYYRQLIAGFILALTFTQASGQAAHKLDSLFETMNRQGSINGTVLIAEDGKPIYKKAFGYADFATKRLNDNNTVFELASVSKQFTSMAIMQLHQNHKINYNERVVKYLPQFPYSVITIDNLLHHTSGLPEFISWGEKQIDVNRINNNADILASLKKNVPMLNFIPGTSLSYSNTNYALLALIVEKVSGESFGQYLAKHIFKPLGMTHTQVYMQRAPNPKIKNFAFGHVYDPGKNTFIINDSLVSNRFLYYLDGVAGPYGISSNTEDLLKWDQALYTEKLVTKAEQELAYTPSNLNSGHVAKFEGMPYGFGWLLPEPKNYTGKIYMHSGGYPGYMTLIVRYPEKKKTIILLTNTWAVINIYELWGVIERILFNKSFYIPKASPVRRAISLNAAQLKTVEGNYTIIAGNKIMITTRAGQAYAQLTGRPKFEVYPESDSTFFYTALDGKLKFKKDSVGKVTKVELLQPGITLRASKD